MCPENIGRVSWFSTIEILRFELMLLKLFYKHFDQNKTILGLQVTATHNFITRLQETEVL
jgi:hypothetical protein